MDILNVDFHTHSNVSDGEFTPEILAIELDKMGLSYASLTDHDTMLGVQRIIEALRAIRSKIILIPGMEITTHLSGKTLHLQAYGLKQDNTDLISFLEEQRKQRRDRAVLIVEKLNTLLKKEGKKEIPIEDILKLETEGPITRPDIATYLHYHGYVGSTQEAFDRWLVQCDIPLETMDIYNTTQFIRDIGGIPILAHAFAPWVSLSRITKDVSKQVDILMTLKTKGLQGVEVYYQGHEIVGEVDGISKNIAMVDSIGLVTTGGSDFHGKAKGNAHFPGIMMPRGRVEKFLELLTK